jgi:putative aminopeptidase FrvX
MDYSSIFIILQSLINAFGPCGQEDEVLKCCQKELKILVDEMWIDDAGNLIGKINGKNGGDNAIRVMVHMDEIALIVKKNNDDGTLMVKPLGSAYAASLGQGPVEILGDNHVITGILSFGSLHTTSETSSMHRLTPKEYLGLGETPKWTDICVITRKTPEDLITSGVHAGTRVVIARSRRKLHFFEDSLAGYFFDNRVGITITLDAFRQLKESNKKPIDDIYFVATCSEEFSGSGASYAARILPGNTTIAIDVGPVAKEYKTIFSPSPIIVYKDGFSTYHKKTSDKLFQLGKKLGLNPQCAIFEKYGSDASLAGQKGHASKIALICFPTENTHGFEIIHKDAIAYTAKLLYNYLLNGNN